MPKVLVIVSPLIHQRQCCQFYMIDTSVNELMHFIKPDIYDGLTASDCYFRNLIPPEALHEGVRMVKPGGIVVIVTCVT